MRNERWWFRPNKRHICIRNKSNFEPWYTGSVPGGKNEDSKELPLVPPYHIAFCGIGGTSAEKNLLTVKLASTHFYDNLPTTGK